MQNDLSNTSQTALAGEMLNPSAALSVDAPVARKPVFAPTEQAVSSLRVSAPESQPDTVFSDTKLDERGLAPEPSDVLGYEVSAENGFKPIFKADAQERQVLRSLGSVVSYWEQNPENEEAALQACFAMANIIMPGTTPEECFGMMRQETFGMGSGNPFGMASRLRNILGSSFDVWQTAQDVESGRTSVEDGRKRLGMDEMVSNPRRSDVAHELRKQGMLDNRTLQVWQYARKQGLSPRGILAAQLLADSYRASTDKNGVAESAPMVMEHFGVPASEASLVAEATSFFAGVDESNWAGQAWDSFADFAGKIVPGLSRDNWSHARDMVSSLLEDGKVLSEGDMAAINLSWAGRANDLRREIEEEAVRRGAKFTSGLRAYKFETPETAQILTDVLREKVKKTDDRFTTEAVFREGLQRNYTNPYASAQVFGSATASIATALSAFTGPYGVAASSAMFSSVVREDVTDRSLAGGADLSTAQKAGAIAAVSEAGLEALTGFTLGKIFSIGKGLASVMGTKTGRGVVEGMDLATMNNSRLSDMFVKPSLLTKVQRGAKSVGAVTGVELATETFQNANQEGIVNWATGGSYLAGAISGAADTYEPESLSMIVLSTLALGGFGGINVSAQSRQERKAVWEAMKLDPNAMEILRESGLVKMPDGIANISELTGQDQSNAVNSYMKLKFAERATAQALYAIDSATDANALTKSGEKLTLAPDAFVNRVMLGDEDGVRYDPEWGTKEKKEFLREKAGDSGITVNKELIRGLDILSTASEIAAKNIKRRVSEAQDNAVEDIDFAGEDATDSPEEHGAILLSDDMARELSAGFLSRKYDMGDADITKEVENAFMGGKNENVDEKVVSALQGIRERALTPYQFSAALDAYARSCAPDLKTRTTAENRADRLGFFGMSHAGVLSDPDSGFDVYTRNRYMVQSSPANRAPIGALSEAQRSKMASALGKIFVGTEVQIGGPVPEWASAGAKIAAEAGEINGIYQPGKVWISDSAFVGTGLHEAVWHATWNWAKRSAPDLFKKMEEFAAKAPRWLREEVAGAYETKFDVSTDEIGAFLFENEFEEEFLEKLVQDKEASGWFDGVKNLFKKAFSKMRGKKPEGDAEWKDLTAHDAVRELMAEFLDGSSAVDEGAGSALETLAENILVGSAESMLRSIESAFGSVLEPVDTFVKQKLQEKRMSSFAMAKAFLPQAQIEKIKSMTREEILAKLSSFADESIEESPEAEKPFSGLGEHQLRAASMIRTAELIPQVTKTLKTMFGQPKDPSVNAEMVEGFPDIGLMKLRHLFAAVESAKAVARDLAENTRRERVLDVQKKLYEKLKSDFETREKAAAQKEVREQTQQKDIEQAKNLISRISYTRDYIDRAKAIPPMQRTKTESEWLKRSRREYSWLLKQAYDFCEDLAYKILHGDPTGVHPFYLQQVVDNAIRFVDEFKEENPAYTRTPEQSRELAEAKSNLSKLLAQIKKHDENTPLFMFGDERFSRSPRKLGAKEWFVPDSALYARLASQVGTNWGERRSVDAYFVDGAVFVCKKRQTHGDFAILDVFSVDVDSNEFEERRKRVVESQKGTANSLLQAFRDEFGLNTGSASRTENGRAADGDGTRSSESSRQAGEVSGTRGSDDGAGVYTEDGKVLAYLVGGRYGQERYEKDYEAVVGRSQPRTNFFYSMREDPAFSHLFSEEDERYSRVRVFHGSPHRFAAEDGHPFGRFRNDKMGTGEGAQAFGWGHYLTNVEGVARGYAEMRRREGIPPNHANLPWEASKVVLAMANIGNQYMDLARNLPPVFLRPLPFLDRLLREAKTYDVFISSFVENIEEEISYLHKQIAYTKSITSGFFKSFVENNRQERATNKQAIRVFENAVEYLTRLKRLLLSSERDRLFSEDEFEVYRLSDAAYLSHLYTAELDDETLLDWVKPMTKEQQLRIADAVREAGLEEEADALADDAKHGTLYSARELHEVDGVLGLNDSSARSKLLHRAGFVGHKFPAQSMGLGDYSRGTNYVVYDESSLNIVDAERWSRTADNPAIRREAMLSAAKMVSRGNGDTVPLYMGAKKLLPQDRQRVIAQARKLYIMATSAYGKGACDIDEAGKRVVAVDKHDRTQGIVMGALRETLAGTDTERKAIERVDKRDREPQRDEETGTTPEVSDEARRLAYETRNAQRLASAARVAFGAEEAERVSGSDLRSRAAAFKSHMEVLGDLFFKDGEKHADHEIMDGLIRQAAEAGMPDELLSRLRKIRDMVAEAGRVPTDIELAQASDLIMQTLSSIDVIRLMKSRGMSMPKDTSASDRAEHASSRAASAMNALESVYAEDTAESLAQKTLARVAIDCWNKLAKKWGFTKAVVDPGALVNDSQFMAKLMEAADKQIKAYEEAEADATTRSKHGALLIPERKAANMEARRLRKDIDRLRNLFREGGAFVRLLKADIEMLAIEQAQGGASGRTASHIAYLRDAKTLGEVMSIGNRLFSLATLQGATWNTPYLRGRLWRLVRSLPKLDERLNDDAAYYTPEFRVFANELRNVASQWWDKSIDEIAQEIEKLSDQPSDDHVAARIRALQMIGGGQFMSSEMLDSAFWQIKADRDFSFIEQRANIRRTRRNVEQEAAAFCEALTANEHRGQRSDSKLKKLAEKVVPGQGFFSIGDRLRGMIKKATGEVYEQAKHYCDRIEKMLSDAASAHDRLVVEQHEWEDKTIREIFGDKWVSEMYELNNVPVPASVLNTSVYDHSTTPGAKLSQLTPMQLLHIYMTAKQKSFQAPLFVNPGAFSESHAAELEARQQYVNDAREGGELETFLKTYKGGKLWKLKEAWQKRWDALYPDLNRAYKDIYGFDMYDPFNEDNYYPLARAYRQTLSISTPGAVVLPVARRFQSRTINVAELDTSKSFMEIQAEQMQNTLHTLAYADAHLQAERMMMNPTVSTTLKTRIRPSDLSELQKHFVNVLGMPSQQEREESSLLASAAVGITNVLALGMNPFPVVRQMLSGASYLAESERGILASSAALLYPLWGGKRYIQDVIRVMSDPLAKARWGEYSRMVADAALRGKVSSGGYFLKRLRNFVMAGINLGDKFTAATAGMGFYRAAYNDGISRGLDDAAAHEKAMNEFMALTEASQQSRRSMNMNWLQRHTFAPVRLITQFRSNQEQAAGHQIRAIADLIANPKDARRWKTFLRKTLAYHFLYAGFMTFVVQAIYAAANSGDDDEDKPLWERIDWKEQLMALSFGGFYGNSFFFVVSQALGIGNSGPSGIAGAPGVAVPTQFVKRVSRASKETWKSMFDEEVEEKQFEEIMRMWIRTTAAGRSAYLFADAIAGKDEEQD